MKPLHTGLVVLVFTIAGCAPASKLPQVDQARAEAERAKQYELLVLDHAAAWKRLHNTAHPILRNNADACGDRVGKAFSFKVISASHFGKDMEEHAVNAGISERPYVIAVPEGSGAARAGVREKDVIVAVGEWRVPKDDYHGDLSEQLETQAEGKVSLPMTFLRNGEELEIDVPLERICDFTLVLQRDDLINAFADGKRITFTTGIMALLHDDDQLAAVIGHEMAHNTMEHNQKGQMQAAAGLVIDLLFAGIGVNTQGAFSNAAAGIYSQEYEAEADYVGLYYTYHAGYDIDEAPSVWRRMSIRNPGSIKDSIMSSHPSSPERFVALEDTIVEIRRKVENGEPIVPNEGYEHAPGDAENQPDPAITGN